LNIESTGFSKIRPEHQESMRSSFMYLFVLPESFPCLAFMEEQRKMHSTLMMRNEDYFTLEPLSMNISMLDLWMVCNKGTILEELLGNTE
jgi:hypothetical protein